jgi:hypothetical protein
MHLHNLNDKALNTVGTENKLRCSTKGCGYKFIFGETITILSSAIR